MIVRTRPFAPAFDQRVDRMFAELTRSLAARTPSVDASWHDGSLRLTVDLPGVPDEAISVDVADRTLTIAVDHDGTEWSRSVRLGTQLDPSSVGAHYAHGRLTVTVDPAPEPEKRRIALDTTPATREVVAATETSASDEATTDEATTDGSAETA